MPRTTTASSPSRGMRRRRDRVAVRASARAAPARSAADAARRWAPRRRGRRERQRAQLARRRGWARRAASAHTGSCQTSVSAASAQQRGRLPSISTAASARRIALSASSPQRRLRAAERPGPAYVDRAAHGDRRLAGLVRRPAARAPREDDRGDAQPAAMLQNSHATGPIWPPATAAAAPRRSSSGSSPSLARDVQRRDEQRQQRQRDQRQGAPPRRRRTPGAATSSHRCAAGTMHAGRVRVDDPHQRRRGRSTRASAPLAAPGAARGGAAPRHEAQQQRPPEDREHEHEAGRDERRAPGASIGIAPSGTGAARRRRQQAGEPQHRRERGRDRERRGRSRRSSPSHGLTGWRRRRTRAKPSTVSEQRGAGGASRRAGGPPTAGSTLRSVTTSRVGARPRRRALVERDERAQRRAAEGLRRFSVDRRVRPSAGARRWPTAAPRGGRAPTSGPCSPTVPGKASRVHWVTIPGPPALVAASWRTASAIVRWRRERPDLRAVGPGRDDRLARRGGCRGRRARAPRRSGPPAGAARARARPRRRRCRRSSRRTSRVRPQASARDDARELEHRRGARELRRGPGPGGVAMGDDDDARARATRACAAEDGRQRAASPSIVSPVEARRGRPRTPRPSARKLSATRRASAASAASPGPAPREGRDERPQLAVRVGAGEGVGRERACRSGAGWSCSEKAQTITASSTGTSAAR